MEKELGLRLGCFGVGIHIQRSSSILHTEESLHGGNPVPPPTSAFASSARALVCSTEKPSHHWVIA